jgi:hypothetical protein
MATTFVSREQTRDGLVTLFDANAVWQVVYGYVPKATSIDGQWPFLIVTSAGTEQDMAGESLNPTKYTFACVSFVLTDDEGTWNEDDAEDKLDEIDKIFRQIIRDNAAGGAFADALTFADSQSRTDYMTIGGVGYRTEEWIITAHHYGGS